MEGLKEFALELNVLLEHVAARLSYFFHSTITQCYFGLIECRNEATSIRQNKSISFILTY